MHEITKISEERWNDYKSLRLEALKTEPTAFGTSYCEEDKISEQIWRERTNHALFAMLNDKPIGMIVYIFENRIKTKHIANIHGFFVTKEYRGRGAGKSLLGQALKQIQTNKDINKIKLSVTDSQKAAINLYGNFGFTVIGQLKNELYVDGKYYDEFIMEKYL